MPMSEKEMKERVHNNIVNKVPFKLKFFDATTLHISYPDRSGLLLEFNEDEMRELSWWCMEFLAKVINKE